MPYPARMLRRVLIACLGVVVVGSLGSCGDDDDDAATATTPELDDSAEDSSTTTDEGERPSDDAPVATDPAEEPPDPGDADEGLGDPLVLIADLRADTEVPGPGDAGATGRIEIESAVDGEWCIDMEAAGLSSAVTDAHVHFGPEGTSGDVVIPIGPPTATEGDTETWTDVCVTVEEQLVNEIVDAPQAFYANVHTSDHPAGAVRGQLEPSSIFDLTLS